MRARGLWVGRAMFSKIISDFLEYSATHSRDPSNSLLGAIPSKICLKYIQSDPSPCGEREATSPDKGSGVTLQSSQNPKVSIVSSQSGQTPKAAVATSQPIQISKSPIASSQPALNSKPPLTSSLSNVEKLHSNSSSDSSSDWGGKFLTRSHFEPSHEEHRDHSSPRDILPLRTISPKLKSRFGGKSKEKKSNLSLISLSRNSSRGGGSEGGFISGNLSLSKGAVSSQIVLSSGRLGASSTITPAPSSTPTSTPTHTPCSSPPSPSFSLSPPPMSFASCNVDDVASLQKLLIRWGHIAEFPDLVAQEVAIYSDSLHRTYKMATGELVLLDVNLIPMPFKCERREVLCCD